MTWFRNCVSKHEVCIGATDDFLPTRLLDVGVAGESLLYLRQSIELPSATEYVTLSHCWGDCNFVRLTRETKSGLTCGISVTELPLTFQHAVEVVRRLCIRYIWVDSLCIFQDSGWSSFLPRSRRLLGKLQADRREPDDNSDWLNESQRMDGVYANAVINIAAAAASNPSQGLFHGASFSHPSITLPSFIKQEIGGPLQWIIEPVMHHLDDIKGSPLNRRGWFQQERFLARRTLFFSKTQLYWSCHVRYASEEWPCGLPEDDSFPGASPYRYMRSMVKFRPKGLSIDVDPELQERAYRCWRDVCSQYSGCVLTFPSDKLIALAGLAQCIGNITKDQYVAGLWRKSLKHDLLWHVCGTGEPRRRPSGYRAPTFSWASIDGEIDGDIYEHSPRFSRWLWRPVWASLQRGPTHRLCPITAVFIGI